MIIKLVFLLFTAQAIANIDYEKLKDISFSKKVELSNKTYNKLLGLYAGFDFKSWYAETSRKTLEKRCERESYDCENYKEIYKQSQLEFFKRIDIAKEGDFNSRAYLGLARFFVKKEAELTRELTTEEMNAFRDFRFYILNAWEERLVVGGPASMENKVLAEDRLKKFAH